jgi:hypothetical protein
MEIETIAIIVVVIVLIFLFIVVVYKNKSYRKRESASSSSSSFLNGIQSFLLAVLCSIIFTAILFYFDYWLQKRIGVNSYAYLLFGILSAIACYFLIKKNPLSIWYVPFTINAPILFPAFFGDFDTMSVYGLILTIITSITVFLKGRNRVIIDKG